MTVGTASSSSGVRILTLSTLCQTPDMVHGEVDLDSVSAAELVSLLDDEFGLS